MIVEVKTEVVLSAFGHEGHGTTTVVNDVIVLHVDVTVVMPPIQLVQMLVAVVTNGVVGIELDNELDDDELEDSELDDDEEVGVAASTGVLIGTVIVTEVVMTVVFILWLQLDVTEPLMV